jgi:hypothetical protein
MPMMHRAPNDIEYGEARAAFVTAATRTRINTAPTMTVYLKFAARSAGEENVSVIFGDRRRIENERIRP